MYLGTNRWVSVLDRILSVLRSFKLFNLRYAASGLGDGDDHRARACDDVIARKWSIHFNRLVPKKLILPRILRVKFQCVDGETSVEMVQILWWSAIRQESAAGLRCGLVLGAPYSLLGKLRGRYVFYGYDNYFIESVWTAVQVQSREQSITSV
jgi:hypothetical protein